LAPAAGVAVAAFLGWTLVNQSNHGGVEWLSAVIAALAVVAAVYAALTAGRSAAKAFAGTAVTIFGLFIALFVDLFPNVMVSTTSYANNITLHEASSTNYTLSVMTVVAVIFVPLVLAYQGWTYYVFSKRLTREEFEPIKSPIDLLAEKTGGKPDDASLGTKP
jgi:cytochrome d ubiquinol oxidase subunit II